MRLELIQQKCRDFQGKMWGFGLKRGKKWWLSEVFAMTPKGHIFSLFIPRLPEAGYEAATGP